MGTTFFKQTLTRFRVSSRAAAQLRFKLHFQGEAGARKVHVCEELFDAVQDAEYQSSREHRHKKLT